MVTPPFSRDPAARRDLDQLKRHVAATFLISASGRIERGPLRHLGPRQTSAVEIVAGPRLFFAGCSAGNIVHVRHDVDDETASRAIAAAEAEPPWRNLEAAPRFLDAVAALFSRNAPVEIIGPEVVFALTPGLTYEHAATIVQADTAEGEQLLNRLAAEGLPQPLLDAGFLNLEDFWWPWCAATDGHEILSMAFTPHLTEAGAEIGVFTFPPFRSHGLAAAVTAGWSSLDSLKGRTLTYSTPTRNRSSRNVAARLGLRSIGVRIFIK